jgi:hypothetical protein
MGEFDDVRSPDDVLRLAQNNTGLNEIDSDSWRPGLAILLDELNSSSAFAPHGRDYVLNDVVKALSRRLKIHDYIKSHPEVLDAPVERPLFVLGMPRTGTTVISYLLDQDPARRSLLHWECLDPVPPATTATLRTDPRCLALVTERNQLLEMARAANMSMPHWEDADGPTEDMFIHNQDFKGLSWDSFMPSPRYAQWLINDADMTSTYQYQKRYLQVLQSAAPGTWSLKMPSHAVHLATLLEVFPDARLVWAHRDPYTATASLANLWKLAKSIVLQPDAIDMTAMGANAKTQMEVHVSRALEIRDRIGDDRFFHMYYHEMMADPMDVMQRLYKWAGDELTPQVEERMRAWLADHPQSKYGFNSYNLDQYSLTVEDLQSVFADYLAAFDVALEGAP